MQVRLPPLSTSGTHSFHPLHQGKPGTLSLSERNKILGLGEVYSHPPRTDARGELRRTEPGELGWLRGAPLSAGDHTPRSPRPGGASPPAPPPAPPALPGASPPLSSDRFLLGALPQVPEHPPRHGPPRDVAGSPSPTPAAPPAPAPPPAGCPAVTHLLARLGRRVAVGCGAGCGCHRVGQILGRPIRLRVIHHLRTAHGSRGRGGARAAAAAAAAAPAAPAAQAGPRRPRAPCGARARQGWAVSGSPCAGSFIFGPRRGPRARAQTAARARSGPPRGGGMTARGPARAAAPTAAPSAAPARAARLRFAHTPRAARPSYPRRCRRGAGRGAGPEGGVGWGGGGARPPGAGTTRSAAKFLRVWPAGGSPAGAPREGPAAIGAEFAASPPPGRGPAVGGEWYARAPRPGRPAVPTRSRSPGRRRGLPRPAEPSLGTTGRGRVRGQPSAQRTSRAGSK